MILSLHFGRFVQRMAQVLFIIALGITIPTAATPQLNTLAPDLATLAVTQPDATVAVIVQKRAALPVEAAVIKLGGRITKNLTLINAFVAELPARQLTQVAQLAGVRWISEDAPVMGTVCSNCIETGQLANVYNQAIGATQVWNQSPYLQGQGIGIAVVDSGIQASHKDMAGRIVAAKNSVSASELFNLPSAEVLKYDVYGHGTFVASLIGGNGATANGMYVGVAPRSQLINVRVSSWLGAATESDVIAGLQWIYENRAAYNIRVVNLSFNASKASSYSDSPLSAACEILWFNGVVVVTSAGNRGEGKIFPPANDPFVITVGATDDQGTPSIADDKIASFSAFGTTVDGVIKPELVAPGRHIVGARATGAVLTSFYPEMLVNQSYMRVSGTSAAAPIVSGAIALLLQSEPGLTPDQVKQRLLNTANRKWAGYDKGKAGAGYLDIAAAVRAKPTNGSTLPSANTGVIVNNLITDGRGMMTELINGITKLVWDSVSWSSVSWSSVSWSSVSWSSVSWSSDYIENAPVNASRGLADGATTDQEQLTSDAALAAIIVAQAEHAASADPATSELQVNQLFLPIVLGQE